MELLSNCYLPYSGITGCKEVKERYASFKLPFVWNREGKTKVTSPKKRSTQNKAFTMFGPRVQSLCCFSVSFKNVGKWRCQMCHSTGWTCTVQVYIYNTDYVLHTASYLNIKSISFIKIYWIPLNAIALCKSASGTIWNFYILYEYSLIFICYI